jgi:hypothetical protein
MTYKEYYLTLNSIDAIKFAAESDINVALMLNSKDRMDKIVEAANEAIEEKFGYTARTNK